MNDKNITYLTFAFGLLGFAFSLWLGYEIAYRHYGYRRTAATVQKIQIEQFLETGDEGGFYAWYRPKITREYSVDGTKFNGSAFSSTGEYFLDKNEAVAFANRFKVGELMTIFYDPSDARRSYVLNGFDWQRSPACFFIFLGSVALIVASHRTIRNAVAAEKRIGF